ASDFVDVLRGTRAVLLRATSFVGRLRRVFALRLRSARRRARIHPDTRSFANLAGDRGVPEILAGPVDSPRRISRSDVLRSLLDAVPHGAPGPQCGISK